MAKKNVVELEIRDEVEFLRPTDAGIYCVNPFYNTNQFNKVSDEKEEDVGVYKVGLASTSFNNRMQQYHTYFPAGVYYICLLSIKPKKPFPKTKEPLEANIKTFLKFLGDVETWIVNRLQEQNVIIIKNNMRVRNEGNTEWVYGGRELIQSVFIEAKDYFSKSKNVNAQLYTYTLREENAKQNNKAIIKKMKTKDTFIAKLYFDLTNSGYKSP